MRPQIEKRQSAVDGCTDVEAQTNSTRCCFFIPVPCREGLGKGCSSKRIQI